MMYYGHGMGAGWTLIVLVFALPVLLLAAGLLFTQLRRDPSGPPAAHMPPQPPVLREAEQILAGRFARGEIDADEYEQRLRTLRAAPH